MAGNLTTLVEHLSALSKAPVARVYRRGEPGTEALHHMWGGFTEKAVDLVSQTLAEEPDHEQRFSLYRLWIEALAERKEQAALRALIDHLFLRGQADPQDHETYAALRGIAHLEVDDFGAAKLLARSMADRTSNAYCMELAQLAAARTGTSEDVPALCRSKVALTDYCQWQSLTRALLVTKDEEALNESLGFIRAQFRGSVLPHLFEYHRCIDSGFYAGAALVAARLSELYPHQADYRYYQGYALFEDGNYPAARERLNEALKMTGEKDAEVVGLLGHCHAKLGEPAKSAEYLRRAVALLKAEGLPTSHISLELANVEEEMRGDQLDPSLEMPRLTRKWLVNLSPRRYHDFATSSENAIDRLLRPMGKDPRPGDICFFATTSKARGDGGEQWRIVGIYAVDSEPMWHPTRRYHSALKLITRLPVGIPVDVASQEDGLDERVQDKNAPINFGVYELDNHAIDIIEEAVRMSRDEMIERRQGSGQSRRPTA